MEVESTSKFPFVSSLEISGAVVGMLLTAHSCQNVKLRKINVAKKVFSVKSKTFPDMTIKLTGHHHICITAKINIAYFTLTVLVADKLRKQCLRSLLCCLRLNGYYNQKSTALLQKQVAVHHATRIH